MSHIDYNSISQLTEMLRSRFDIHHLSCMSVLVTPMEPVLRFEIKKSEKSKPQYLDIEYMNFRGDMVQQILEEFVKEIPPYLI